jgi:hypothetical protein
MVGCVRDKEALVVALEKRNRGTGRREGGRTEECVRQWGWLPRRDQPGANHAKLPFD